MISVKKVSKSYKNIRALTDFSYDFEVGIYAILGPNGSGKSTLMNVMTGNLKADSGTITMLDSHGIPDYMLGYVPQYPGMYNNFTAFEMLDYVGILKNAENRKKQIEMLLAAFDLEEYKNKKIGSLSGGTKQRLAIAQAFMGNPKLVILDEPTAGLDPLQRVKVKNFLTLQSEKMTIIISTHIVSDVENIANEVIFLKKGRIVLSGKLDKITQIDGNCFCAPAEKMPADFCGVHRFCGSDVRVIADQKPFDGANLVAPELEDIYLSVFCMGEEQ